jgi:hypothetical protein
MINDKLVFSFNFDGGMMQSLLRMCYLVVTMMVEMLCNLLLSKRGVAMFWIDPQEDSSSPLPSPNRKHSRVRVFLFMRIKQSTGD